VSAAPQSQNELPSFDLAKLSAESQKLWQDFMQQHHQQAGVLAPASKGFLELAQHYMENPEQWMRLQLSLYQNYLNLWANVADSMMGREVQPVATPERGDRRFKHQAWEEHFVFDYIKQSYLLTANIMLEHVAEVASAAELDEGTQAQVSFYTKQFLDALSPTNFPMTNPQVLEETIATNGENLINGLKNILADIERGNGTLKISMTDKSAFEVGKNLAMTQGQVVFRNRMIELIQYQPTTKQVQAMPLLIAPPWINKFYILDLQPENSFVKYAVDQGFQVFMISWKNVDESYRDTGFEDYLKDGLSAAIDATLNITKQKQLNAIGYCIGGTLLAAGLSVFKAKNDTRVASATFFTTLMDFSEAGELK